MKYNPNVSTFQSDAGHQLGAFYTNLVNQKQVIAQALLESLYAGDQVGVTAIDAETKDSATVVWLDEPCVSTERLVLEVSSLNARPVGDDVFKFPLGVRLKSIHNSDLTGVTTSRQLWVNGCVAYTLQMDTLDKDGTVQFVTLHQGGLQYHEVEPAPGSTLTPTKAPKTYGPSDQATRPSH